MGLSFFRKKDRVEKIVNALSLKVHPRDLQSKDPKVVITSILSQWLPLASTILLATVEALPSPPTCQKLRLSKVMEGMAVRNELLETSTYSCQGIESVPVLGYISKMFSVPFNSLPRSLGRDLTLEEKRVKRMEAVRKAKGVLEKSDRDTREMEEEFQLNGLSQDLSHLLSVSSQIVVSSDLSNNLGESESDLCLEENKETLIAFTRLYSGVIKKGQTLYLLHPKYNPKFPNDFVSEILVERLFLLMGRDLMELDSVPAGNIFGISGLGDSVIKTGTLSSTKNCPSLGSLKTVINNIVRVAIESVDPSQMSKLIAGLKLLNYADPTVEVLVQESGEHVINCAGELHLEVKGGPEAPFSII